MIGKLINQCEAHYQEFLRQSTGSQLNAREFQN